MPAPRTPPADACAPDPHRARRGMIGHHRLPEPVLRLLVRLVLVLLRLLAARGDRTGRSRAWCHLCPDLDAGSGLHLAAVIRGPFGNAIAWMCLYRGIGPGHRDWPELSRAIQAFGGQFRTYQPGGPAFGLPWWENPRIMPGLPAEPGETPAADGLVALLARDVAADAPAPAPRAAAPRRPALKPASRHPVRARAGTAPPTGPPLRGAAAICCA
jgi:hypothetical protein